jgi:hypothetical protein
MKDIIIALICKNEYDYLKEFVEYHLNLGFDKIVIADNNDTDGERYDELLKEYIDKGQVILQDWRGQHPVQRTFYNKLIIERPIPYEWCAFIDTDEFVTFGKKSKFKTIREFLESNPDVKAYKLNWQVYGDNGKIVKEEGNVVDRFPNPKEKNFHFHYKNIPENAHVKSILRYDAIGNFVKHPHTIEPLNGENIYSLPDGTPVDNSPFNANLDFSIIYLRHYYTKSLEEWITKKMGRRYADCPYIENFKYYPLEDFFIYNIKTKSKEDFLKETIFQLATNH